MGKLGWTEREYYTSSPEAFFYARRGYFAKLVDESLATRNAATIIYRALGGKKNIDVIWPLDNEKPKETFQAPTKEWWDQMKAKQAKINKQISDERRKNQNNSG